MKPIETVKYWRMPQYDNLECLHATYFTHTFAPHYHEEFAIGIITRGAEAFDYRGARHVAPNGSIVIVNPGEIHTGNAWGEAGWTYRMTYPGTSLLQRIASEMTGGSRDVPFFKDTVITDPEVVQQFWALHVALEENETGFMQDALLRESFGLLIERYADSPIQATTTKEPASVRKARALLEARFNDSISLDEIAAAVGLSPFHLSREFKRETGLPPHKYLTQVRINRARKLLSDGMAISDVAVVTGFADQSHLTKWFKRVTGISPGQYQRFS